MNKKALIALFILALININAANAQEIAEGKIVPVNNTSEYSAQGSWRNTLRQSKERK